MRSYNSHWEEVSLGSISRDRGAIYNPVKQAKPETCLKNLSWKSGNFFVAPWPAGSETATQVLQNIALATTLWINQFEK